MAEKCEKNLLDHIKYLFSRAHLLCTYSPARTTQQKGNRINSLPVPNTFVYCIGRHRAKERSKWSFRMYVLLSYYSDGVSMTKNLGKISDNFLKSFISWLQFQHKLGCCKISISRFKCEDQAFKTSSLTFIWSPDQLNHIHKKGQFLLYKNKYFSSGWCGELFLHTC